MKDSEFLAELEFILELDPGTLDGDAPLACVGGWDSMAFLAFIAMVDEKTGHTLEVKDIKKCVTAFDLMRLCGAAVEA